MHWTERSNHLRGEDREMAGSRCRVLDDERPTLESGVGRDRRFCRKHGSVEELIPDRQREAQVDVLWAVDLVVNAVVVRADEDAFEGPETQPRIRVSERNH